MKESFHVTHAFPFHPRRRRRHCARCRLRTRLRRRRWRSHRPQDRDHPVLIGTQPGAQGHRKVTGIRDCVGNPTHEPRSITLTCADAGYQVVKLKWQNWGAKRAAATGVAVVNTCEPSCADGTFERFNVRVIADRLAVAKSSAEYRRLTVVYTGARPTGLPARDVYRVTKRGPFAVS